MSGSDTPAQRPQEAEEESPPHRYGWGIFDGLTGVLLREGGRLEDEFGERGRQRDAEHWTDMDQPPRIQPGVEDAKPRDGLWLWRGWSETERIDSIDHGIDYDIVWRGRWDYLPDLAAQFRYIDFLTEWEPKDWDDPFLTFGIGSTKVPRSRVHDIIFAELLDGPEAVGRLTLKIAELVSGRAVASGVVSSTRVHVRWLLHDHPDFELHDASYGMEFFRLSNPEPV